MIITVGMCTYNSEKYLPEQLETIIHQTLRVNEIVVIDDASTDQTIDILNDYVKRYPDLFRIIRNEKNMGARKNFERALAESKGEIIFLSDHDDYWMPEKVAKVVAYFNSHPQDKVVFTNAMFMDENSASLPSTLWDVVGFTPAVRAYAQTKDDLLRYLLKHGRIVTGATLALRKESLGQILPFRLMHKIWHDAWIALVAANAKMLGYIEEPLIRYRVHSKQQVGYGYMEKIKGNNAVPVLQMKELKGETGDEELIQLIHVRRKRVRLVKRLSRFIQVDPVIKAEILQERKASEKAFSRAKSLPVRLLESFRKMFK
ncbi:glycosyltransferase [Chitinophaga sancti]|uniref:glycosyltransferase n=1 Tax=Chitinophaga sancti TaxID=1004 RepID=UPI0015A693CF|nr:glycosyltransferase [Chitinophaga sancti]